jgi:aldehyde:ferredoxin oxidoreductase
MGKINIGILVFLEEKMALNMDSKMKDLLAHPETRAILEKHMGDLLKDPRMKMGMGFPLKVLFKSAPPGIVPPGTAEAIEADLNKLGPIEVDKNTGTKTTITLTMDSKMKELLAYPETRAIMEKHMGDLLKDPRMKMGMGFPLKVLFKSAPPGIVPPGTAEAIEADLSQLGPIEVVIQGEDKSQKKSFFSFLKLKKKKRQVKNLGGYMGKVLRVDLTNEKITEERLPDQSTLRKFVGGTGLGIRMIYNEVPAGIEWSDPRNRIIWLTGPFTGTRGPGSGTYTVATKGPLTNFFVATHCNGFFGTSLRQAGYDGIIVQGQAKRWVYLTIQDGVAEFHDASQLIGKDTWETEKILLQSIKGDKGKPSASCIGPAGENLVKYAGICSDEGHIASSNGAGAVMGSKKLKGIVVRGTQKVPIHDQERFNELVKEWWTECGGTVWGQLLPTMGTNGQFASAHTLGTLPVRNYTTSVFPTAAKFNGDAVRDYYKGKPKPCFACRLAHCQEMMIQSGPHKGEIVEEPEYEPMAAFSSMIGNDNDLDGAVWLANVNDRLGMDAKEQATVLGLAIECYEKGLITKKDTDGLELTWGNIEAVETLMRKIATRDGFGNVLAEGVMRAANTIGGEAPNFAVYTHKGVAPHVHDDRGLWNIAFSMAVSDMGSIPAGDMGDVGDLLETIGDNFLDPARAFDAEYIPKCSALMWRRGHFVDCLGICMFVAGVSFKLIAETLNAVTGWDFTWQECTEVGERVMTMMRSFNVKNGHTRADNSLSPRILQAPVDGPAKGVSIAPKLDLMLDIYNEALGWDNDGKPLPKTLTRLGLKDVAKELAKI